MSSQQPSTPLNTATLVWRAVTVALCTGFVWGSVLSQLLMTPDSHRGGLGLLGAALGTFAAAALTLSTYLLTRAALNSLRP
jgi:hypothetical protein